MANRVDRLLRPVDLSFRLATFNLLGKGLPSARLGMGTTAAGQVNPCVAYQKYPMD
jgi:hypothetical protein